MKAIVRTEYGSPDVLHLEEVEKPAPGDNEVLVKVEAASVNPLDWHLLRGEPFISRLGGGFKKPENMILGADIAGRVEAIGKNVTKFKPGDDVFGDISASGLGGFAQYARTHEDSLALKPKGLSFEEAASTPVVGFTAIQGLRDKGQIKAGQKVLINGASGGIGTFAVQFAKACGAEVTGVCSTRNLDLVRSIGADHVIDYTREDFTTGSHRYDLIYDTVGNLSVLGARRALSPNGMCVVAGFTTLFRMFEVVVLGSLVSRTGSRKVGLMGIANANQKDLLFIRELLETGKVRPVIDRRYPLGETPQAIRYLETGRARGKVIVTIGTE